MDKIEEFRRDTSSLNLFSYEDYKNSSLESKLEKIRLLNEYYKLKYGSLPKLPVYIDCDGVILNTIECLIPMLLDKHNIDLSTHDRSFEEQERKIAQFFSNLDWNRILNEASEINKSKEFIKLMKDSSLYIPTIYSAVNSESEEKQKRIFFARELPGINCKFVRAKFPKQCDDDISILIDDDDFNLTYWQGKPLHLGSERKTIFPSINDLGEIYYLFVRNENNPEEFIITHGLYDDYTKTEDTHTKKMKWTKK